MAEQSAPPILHPRSPRDEEQTRRIWNEQQGMNSRDPAPGDNGEGGTTTVTGKGGSPGKESDT
jgi:hypothetical protein